MTVVDDVLHGLNENRHGPFDLFPRAGRVMQGPFGQLDEMRNHLRVDQSCVRQDDPKFATLAIGVINGAKPAMQAGEHGWVVVTCHFGQNHRRMVDNVPRKEQCKLLAEMG